MFSTTPATHILVYPFSTSGHIIPLLDLTHRLLTAGLTITVVITPSNLHLLNPLLSSHASSHLHHLVLPNPQILPSSGNRLIATMRSFRQRHYPALLDWFRSHPSPPVAIISDFFLGWTYRLAQQVGVPRVVFSPSGALAFSVSASTWRDQPQNGDPENMDFAVSFPSIPNSPSFPWWQISHIYRMLEARNPDWELHKDCFLDNLASWGIVVNSFADLELPYINHLKNDYGSERVWAVGPVLPSDDNDLTGPVNRGGSSTVPCHKVLTWLDSCNDDSVVYVCFGSRTVLTCKQMDELATALEKSGICFIFSVRQPDERQVARGDGVLPDGFEDRVAGRGFVIRGWAPQVAILRHRAVGVFLTHCGWNSVLEGIAAGVVMLTWPMSADQFTNANLMVDELGAGIRVGEGTRKIPKSDKLAQVLAESVEANRAERVKAKKLKEAAWKAVKGGSSSADLDEFVKRLNDVAAGGVKSHGNKTDAGVNGV